MRAKITIFRSANSDKIEVYGALSSEEEIRIYFNEKQYVTAIDKQNGNIEICYTEEKTQEKLEHKNLFAQLKENKDLGCIFLAFILSYALFLGIFFSLIEDTAIVVMLTIMVWWWVLPMYCIFLENNIPFSLKSKHAAEHMMLNFIREYKRLPTNMEEIKKASRFSPYCGTRIKLIPIFEVPVMIAINTLPFLFIYLGIKYIGKEIFEIIPTNVLIIFGILVIILLYVMSIVTYKYVEKICKKLSIFASYLVQYFNTAKKVKEEDIILAYFVAKYWMMVVYPEFYINDDSICEQYQQKASIELHVFVQSLLG